MGGGGGSRRCRMRRVLLLALVLGSLLAQPSRASFFFNVRWASTSQTRGGGYRDEKVPMTVVVPDFSPRPAPVAAAAEAPTSAPAAGPVPGADTAESMPKLPTEPRAPRAPSGGHRAGADAPAGATSTDFISSNPAVPLPAGVTDSATVLPMPTPGRQRRDDVGMGAPQLQTRARTLAAPLLMMMLPIGAVVDWL